MYHYHCLERTVSTLLIEQVASEHPDLEAICSRSQFVTYKELNEYASMIARRLEDHGVKPETVVPMCFENSIWAVVAMLAVLKAGGAFLSLPCTSMQRAKEMLIQIDHPGIMLVSQASC
jgi:non-ribosomal peptide synthetase component F